MSGSCFLPGCSSGYGGTKTHLFKFPKAGSVELKNQWIKLLPKRKDLAWSFQKCRLCHIHFEDKYIQKENTVTFEGKVIAKEARKNWTLRPDAIPTIFSNSKIPKYFDKQLKKRRAPCDRSENPKKRKIDASVSTEVHEEIEEFTFSHLLQNWQNLDLPNSNWIIQPSPCKTILRIFQLQSETDDGFDSLKVNFTIVIREDLSKEVLVRGRKFGEKYSEPIRSLIDIRSLVYELQNAKLCPGVANFDDIKTCKMDLKSTYHWFSKQCAVISDKVCSKCLQLKKYLKVIKSRRKLATHDCKKIATKAQKRRKLISRSQQLRHLQARSAKERMALKLIQRKLLGESEDRLVDAIKATNGIPENLKLSMISSVKLAKAKSKTGKRYQADWLLQCLLLKIKSPKAHQFLRDNHLLPLPHPTTLHKLVSGIPCEFGFTDFVFQQLKEEFKNKSKRDKQVVLSFDEIKVKESLQFDKFKMEFHGLIDYGEYTYEYFNKKQGSSQMADHALVFMIRSLSDKWAQPVGAFASRGAAPAFILAKLLLSCIIRLEKSGVNVCAIVSDGAQTNKSVWNTFGISGKSGEVINKIIHPIDKTRELFFVSDMPHIMKCVRNNLMKKKIAFFNNQVINWKYYEAVYLEDSKRTIRAAPKLTNAHLNPLLFQKMIVRFATQLFSKSVAQALQFYRTIGVQSLNGSESTQEFTIKLNDLFNALNATYTKVSVRKGDKRYEDLLQFYEMINGKPRSIMVDYLQTPKNTFASETTMASLRVTIKSSIELIDYLTFLGFHYVLTAKFNQDCLEKFFGLIRSINGDDSHPTVPNFMYLYRLLCLQVPTSKTLKGNIQTTEHSPGILFCYAHTLKKLSEKRKQSSHIKKSGFKDKILQKLILDQSNPSIQNIADKDHDYAKNNCQQPCLLFQLCGYLAHKANKFSKCEDCLNTLVCSSEDCSVAPESYFTSLKSLGGLKFPSKELYNLIDRFVLRV